MKFNSLWNLFKIFNVHHVHKSIIAKNKEQLIKLIKKETAINGYSCDLNNIDVSQVTDMSHLFYGSPFKGDISQWNVSNVTDMNSMFSFSRFKGDISKWDVSNLTNMSEMFYVADFNGDLTNWKPYKLEKKQDMFYRCAANKPYWYSAENIIKTIKSYSLNEKLNNELTVRPTNKNRLKI